MFTLLQHVYTMSRKFKIKHCAALHVDATNIYILHYILHSQTAHKSNTEFTGGS